MLALTGRNFGTRPSSLLRIDDGLVALGLDLTCTARLEIYDAEREKRQLEAMSGGLLMNALQGPQRPQQATASKKMKEGSF